VVRPNTLTFVSGLILATVTGTAVYWRDKAVRARDAIEYMVSVEEDPDEILKEWSGEQ
jgi:hypothetical protein